MEEAQINEDTSVPLRFVFALVGCSAAVLAVTCGLVLWGARLEAAVATKVPKEQYIQDMVEMKADVKAIKRHLKIPD